MLTQTNPEHVDIALSFDKEFYKELTSIKSIRYLRIDEKFENLDCDLFLKLDYLRTFSLGTEKLEVDFISKLCKMKSFYRLLYRHPRFYIIFCVNMDRDHPKYYFTISHTKNGVIPVQADGFSDCFLDLVEEIKQIKAKNEAYLRGSLI